MKLSFFLPFNRFVLETPLTPADIRQRLIMNVEERRQFKFSFVREETTKPYEGEVSTFNFDISRIIRNRNSFLPEIRGSISPMQGMTLIKITMMPHIFIFTGMLIMLGLVLVFCVGF